MRRINAIIVHSTATPQVEKFPSKTSNDGIKIEVFEKSGTISWLTLTGIS